MHTLPYDANAFRGFEPRPLPRGSSVFALAEQCRASYLRLSSLLGIAERAPGDRDRIAFVEWLVDDYESTLLVAGNVEAEIALDCLLAKIPFERRGVIAFARELIAALVERASTWDVEHARTEAVQAGLVDVVCDHFGFIGYAPRSSPEMSFLDRITALVLADSLSRPADLVPLYDDDDSAEVDDARSSGVVAAGTTHEPELVLALRRVAR